jgi:hypothetical protein
MGHVRYRAEILWGDHPHAFPVCISTPKVINIF